MTSANTSAKTGPRRHIAWRIARAVLVLVLAVLLLPYLLAPLYRIFDPVSTVMLWRWMKGGRVERSFVLMERIAPVMARTVIASEDAKFCSHRGIDWGELRAAIDDADELSEARGASTITQQTVKNLFLWPGRSFVRKALEFPLALWLDLVLPKRRVMEIYLNIAEWGRAASSVSRPGRGARSASRRAISTRPRPPCWSRCCRTRTGAMRSGPDPVCGASPRGSRPAPPRRATSTPACGCADPDSVSPFPPPKRGRVRVESTCAHADD